MMPAGSVRVEPAEEEEEGVAVVVAMGREGGETSSGPNAQHDFTHTGGRGWCGSVAG